MLISNKTFYGIDNEEVKHLLYSLYPTWEKDPDINEKVLKVACVLMSEKVKEDDKELFLPRCVLTTTTKDIIDKIKITPNTIALIEPEPDKFLQIRGKYSDSMTFMGHISFEREFYRYIIVSKTLYVVHCFLYKDSNQYIKSLSLQQLQSMNPDEIRKKSQAQDYVGYSVWHFDLGFPAEKYKVDEFHPAVVEFFKIFVFLKYTTPEICLAKSGRKTSTKKTSFYNQTQSDVLVVDSTWNKIIVREEGFSVSGHIRLQPYGEGLKNRKLIWIEPFKKEGYVRKGKGV